jgi:hypothetical protein
MLKNGEAPQEMAVRVKDIAITTALIGCIPWTSAIFLDTTVRQIAVGSDDFSRRETARGGTLDSVAGRSFTALPRPHQCRTGSRNAICGAKNFRRAKPTGLAPIREATIEIISRYLKSFMTLSDSLL